jgi:hypothetical protein
MPSHRRHPWADLLQRVFDVDVLCCPRCGGRMRILAAITDADIARRILACLALPTRAPPAASVRPLAEPDADATPGTGWPGSDAFDVDQTVAEDWGSGA